MLVEKLNALRSENDSEAGFTLIELMIVVVIIGVLAAIAIPVFMNQQKSALAAGVKSDVKNTVTNISTALVKAPTAAQIGGPSTSLTHNYSKNETVPVGALDGTTGIPVVISDDNTTLAIGGTWQGYRVQGLNTGLSGSYIYLSTVGIFQGAGDFK